MAAPLSLEMIPFIPKLSSFRFFLSQGCGKKSLLQPSNSTLSHFKTYRALRNCLSIPKLSSCTHPFVVGDDTLLSTDSDKTTNAGRNCHKKGRMHLNQCFKETKLFLPSDSASFSIIPVRCYGRKMKPKPQRITYFEYSGDLRTLPEHKKDTLLYPYKGLEEDLALDETLKKLASFEFGSGSEKKEHLQELIQDRIIELFGPDSELEQEVARLTLRIRQMIPYCIKQRTDKGNKILLLKSIFRRRNLLTHLRHIDHERFAWLLRELKIRYVIPYDREEYKGWKHNLREATKSETMHKQRQKLEELKNKFEAEKEEFAKHKTQVLSKIEQDLKEFGLGKDFLDQLYEEASQQVLQVAKESADNSGVKQT